MKPEINAAANFLSRIFLSHPNITSDKVTEFQQRLSDLLEARYCDHWHEGCPTKGQAYRCIRICPDDPLDPILEKVCTTVGINMDDFNLPMELTLWVDPKEVTCKFGDLKCSYHTVAKKDQTSGALDNKADHFDIEDLIENARDLYLKKQTVVIHPIHSTEMHIQNHYSDGSPGNITMAIRMSHNNVNNVSGMQYSLSSSPPASYDGSSPRGKNKSTPTSAHKRNGFPPAYYGKASALSNGKSAGGGFVPANTAVNANSLSSSPSNGSMYQQHNRSHSHHHHHHHHNGGSPYQNGYLSSYMDDVGFPPYDHRSTSPSKMNGMMNGNGNSGQHSQTSPTPEQIQQQMQHPPPLGPPPPHLPQPFPPTDTSSLPPPPISQQQAFSHPPPPPPPLTSVNNVATSGSSNNNSSGSSTGTSAGHGGKGNNSGSNKFQGNNRVGNGGRHRNSPVKDVK